MLGFSTPKGFRYHRMPQNRMLQARGPAHTQDFKINSGQELALIYYARRKPEPVLLSPYTAYRSRLLWNK